MMPEIVSNLLHTAMISAMTNWNLHRLPFQGQIVNLDLLLCKGFNSHHADLFLYIIYS